LAKLFLSHALRKYSDRRPWAQRLLWRFEALIMALFWTFCAWLSPSRASAFGGRLLRLIGPRLPKHRIFRLNLGLVFPEKPPAEIDTLARAAWGNAGAVLAEYPHLKAIREQGIETVIQGDSDVFRHHKPAIFVSAHVANWEICVAAIVRLGIPLTGLYSPLQNPWLDRLLWNRRLALECGMLKRDDSMRPLIRQLNKGDSLGFLVDQRIDSGSPVPFFGMDKMTTLAPARLALRFGCEMIPVRAERLKNACYRVTFYESITPDDAAADEQEQALQMMRKTHVQFENWIRERPGEWLCSKRRWAKGLKPVGF